jgi:hypothetical protein
MSAGPGLRNWVMAAAVAGLVGWWLAPLPDPVPGLVKSRQDGWRLAPLPRRVDQTSTAAMVNSANFWGTSAAAAAALAAAPIEDPRWRIAAIYGAGKDRATLIQFSAKGKPAVHLRVGDSLPSGHRIVSISDKEVCMQIGKKAYRLGVERSGS